MTKPIKSAAALTLAVSILLTLTGCTGKPDAVPTPTAAVQESAAPTPAPTPTPEPAATPEPTPEPTATPNPNIPVITVVDATEPSDMKAGNVVDIRGVVKTDKGQLTNVTGRLLKDGEVVQEYAYVPYSPEFSLAGTVNASMHFADLGAGEYTYQLTASAENKGETVETVLIDKKFTLYLEGAQNSTQTETAQPETSAAPAPVQSAAPAASNGKKEYAAQTTYDTSNAGIIWNYFVEQFDNPYSAAAILGCIDSESSCEPTRVEGDFTSQFYFSQDYTDSIDNGSINREAFIKYLPRDKCGHGYGLCQWTGERKGYLYDLAMENGTSVGDLLTQCEFIMQELRNDYPELLEYLVNAEDELSATLEFSKVYLQALIHGGRTTLASEYLDKYALVEETE
mgnify:CR=1 FL=1